MRLSTFHVRGYKNFQTKVTLDGLSTVNVIHGPNNIGKSNLLEAMTLYFRLLGLEEDGWLPLSVDRRIPDEEMRQRGFPRTDIFNLERPDPIEMSAVIAIPREELASAGIKPLLPCDQVTVSIVLQWTGQDIAYRVRQFTFADGTDAASAQSSPEKKTFVLKLAKFLMQNFLIRTAARADRFALILADRHLDDDLALALFDAKESTDIEQVRRWERFVAVMKTFTDVLGEGSFVSIYDRKSSRASLVYQRTNARVPFHLLGSGARQIATLVAGILMTNATLVAIEEPEINLRYSLQERLRATLAAICGAPGGPTQIFLTSHSPAFESGDHFYMMSSSPGGPAVARHPIGEAAVATDFPATVSPAPEKGVRSYVSSDGVVRIPERLLGTLGVPGGGGVMFIEHQDKGMVEMMSNAAFLEKLGLEDDDGDDERG